MAGGLFTTSVHAEDDADTQRAEIRQMRDEVLQELFKLKPELKSRVKNAEGYAVFTNIGVNLIFASFAGGKGIVLEHSFFGDDETIHENGIGGDRARFGSQRLPRGIHFHRRGYVEKIRGEGLGFQCSG